MNARFLIAILACTAALLTSALAYLVQRGLATSKRISPVEITRPILPKMTPVREGKTPEPIPLPGKFTWQQIESADYKQYIANLRAAGCPEETIREIIVTDVNKLYAPREAPFKTLLTVPLPWDGPGTVSYSSLSEEERRAEIERKKQLREVQLEKRALLKELLNIETPLETVRGWHSRDYEMFEAAFNSLPDNKRELVRQIQENYWQTSDTTSDKFNGLRGPDYLDEYKRNNAERRAALARVLSPQELEDYELKTSSTATRLAAQLNQFNPTPDEFRQIARIKLAIDQPYGGALTADSAEQGENGQGVAARQQEANEKIRQALGEERFAEYQRSQDYNYRSLSNLGERYGLSKEAVLKAFEAQKEANDQIQKIRMDQTLSNEQRTDALRKAQAQSGEYLSGILGEKAYGSFSRRSRNYYGGDFSQ